MHHMRSENTALEMKDERWGDQVSSIIVNSCNNRANTCNDLHLNLCILRHFTDSSNSVAFKFVVPTLGTILRGPYRTEFGTRAGDGRSIHVNETLSSSFSTCTRARPYVRQAMRNRLDLSRSLFGMSLAVSSSFGTAMMCAPVAQSSMIVNHVIVCMPVAPQLLCASH